MGEALLTEKEKRAIQQLFKIQKVFRLLSVIYVSLVFYFVLLQIVLPVYIQRTELIRPLLKSVFSNPFFLLLVIILLFQYLIYSILKIILPIIEKLLKA
ncbi:MAG: hypothetical protein WC552_04620 [Candidatus Omnitrophota bacterium]